MPAPKKDGFGRLEPKKKNLKKRGGEIEGNRAKNEQAPGRKERVCTFIQKKKKRLGGKGNSVERKKCKNRPRLRVVVTEPKKKGRSKERLLAHKKRKKSTTGGGKAQIR